MKPDGQGGLLMTRLLSLLAVCETLFCLASLLRAQGPQPPPVSQAPTTVQLPTFSFFTVQTTVSVPDGGGAYLGGINRGASGSTMRGIGPLKNRAIGSARAASGVSVSATIIDHEEIDRALLATAAANRSQAANPTAAKAAALSSSVGRRPAAPAAGVDAGDAAHLPDSLAAIRERNSAAANIEASELAGYFARARQAETDGKVAVAKVFYQMVARRDRGELKYEAEKRLASLGK
jgi:hypothetical protein